MVRSSRFNPACGVITLALCLTLIAAVANAAPSVVVTIKPVHSIVAGIMQGVAEPVLLIDGEVEPWRFEPDAAQRAAIADADLLIWVGPELEARLAPLVGRLSDQVRVETLLDSDQLKVLSARDDDTQRDAFFWLDSRNALILLDDMTRRLAAIDPANAAHYERNRASMLQTIADLDREMEFAYRDVSGVPVFFYHDTHQYFEQAYAMHVAGSVVRPGGDSSSVAAHLLTMRSDLVEVEGACVFVEKGMPQSHLEMVTDGLPVNVVEIDSLGSGMPTGPALYVDMMRDNFGRIAGCVKRFAPKRDQSELQTVDATAPDEHLFPEQVTPRYLLIDQFGRTVTNTDFQGRLQIIYFGYTFCPDICPTSLAAMSKALKLLGDEQEQIQPLFITVDPQRDTPQVLGGYVTYFHPRMLGLSSSPEVLKRTAELFKARYERVEAESGNPDRYSMDHTASLYLLGRNGEFLTKFAHGMPPEEIARELRGYLQN